MNQESDRRAVGTYEWVRALTSIDFDESPEIRDSAGKPFKRPAGKSIKGVAWRISYWGDSDGTRVFLGPARIAVSCEVDYKTAKVILRTLCAYKLLTLVQRGGGVTSAEREGNGGEYRLTIPNNLAEIAKVRTKEEIDAEIEAVKEKNRNNSTGQRRPRNSRGSQAPVSSAAGAGDTGQSVPPAGESRGTEGGSHGAMASAIPTQHQPLKENQPVSLSDARTSVPAPREATSEDRERDDSTSSEDQNPNTPTAAQRVLAKRGLHGIEADRAESWIRRNVPAPIQGDGWWYRADTNGSLDDWLRRWRDSTTPQSAEVEPAIPCPLHSRHPLNNCGVCWNDVIGGTDPYAGREHERPEGWWAIYNQQPRTSDREGSAEARKAHEWLALPGKARQLHNSHDNPERYDVKL